jgi:hypothetical protein
MNERIRQLAEQAIVEKLSVTEFIEALKLEPHDFYEFRKSELEKFAELIVKECVSVIAKRQNQAIDDGCNVDEAVSMAMMDLLEHFGVEE